MLHADFPVVEGNYQLTPNWGITLPGKFNRRIEEGDLVLWNPQLTIWIAIWNNDHAQSQEARLENIKKVMSNDAHQVSTSSSEGMLRFSYRLHENISEQDGIAEEPETVAAFHCFALGERGQVEMAVYLDSEADVKQAEAILLSLKETVTS
ncbi:hypothetical protein [Undibacterium parvum]|uniref:Uncharacterized protein n=1 Tax=Undibacterium parvum TaxID=401471 RepID=A0A3Q9BNB1_9BURK|nr:hypothetical protein [Undibacterium parvum]AZP10866.1 hypothetical protein EJN92_01780 [Undibacterium parvum]